MTKYFYLIFAFLVPLQLFSQIDTMALKTPEGITAKMLEFISFEKGETKDWDEFRNLFLPTAQMIALDPDAPPHRQASAMNLEEFIRYAGPNYPKEGFEEIVIGVEVDEFNGIATVFQSFHCKTPSGSYEARGINSYQLVYLNDRWWIAGSMFINESEDVKLPNKYLFEEYQTKTDKLKKKKGLFKKN